MQTSGHDPSPQERGVLSALTDTSNDSERPVCHQRERLGRETPLLALEGREAVTDPGRASRHSIRHQSRTPGQYFGASPTPSTSLGSTLRVAPSARHRWSTVRLLPYIVVLPTRRILSQFDRRRKLALGNQPIHRGTRQPCQQDAGSRSMRSSNC